jgi:ADP-dependent NAD(P)H-hydrate dehydratase / NAD(P)H-hydrate epimerase
VIAVVSRGEMRAFDAHAIDVCRVPSLVLMENAGRGAAEVVLEGLAPDARVVILCGGGNNGGDGFVVARHLVTRGLPIQVHLCVAPETLKGDARVNHDALVGLGVPIQVVGSDLRALRADLERADRVVDALFGTGLDRPLSGTHAACVELVNQSKRTVVAIDIPSGMNADTGEPMGVAVRATRTVTFGLPKLGLLTPHGTELAGTLHVADLGVPASLALGLEHSAWLLEASDVAGALPPRRAGAHKGTGGHVAVFAGSSGKVGAALLSGRAALRAGAGLVTIATWPESADAIEGRVEEVMTERLDRHDLLSCVDRVLHGKRAVVLGPGFGTDDAARAVVEHVLATWQGPSVVDADALAMFEGRPEVFASSRGAPVLTPHPGELGKLLSRSVIEIEADRFGAIAAVVARARCVVVLKGAHTLVGAPDERTVINASGNPALATGGAGDVLSGILGALLSLLDPFEAAWAGVHIHGAAADRWRDRERPPGSRGRDRGLLAHEVADLVPDVIEALVRAGARGDCLD